MPAKREPITHRLKTWPEPFKAICAGHKRHELRANDRNYQVGDFLLLQEYDPSYNPPIGHPEHGCVGRELQCRYTGKEFRVRVTYITDVGDWMPHVNKGDSVIMSITPEPALAWTTKEPRIPGYYWVRTPRLSARVMKFHPVPGMPQLMTCDWPSLGLELYGKPIEYIGPIQAPTDMAEAVSKVTAVLKVLWVRTKPEEDSAVRGEVDALIVGYTDSPLDEPVGEVVFDRHGKFVAPQISRGDVCRFLRQFAEIHGFKFKADRGTFDGHFGILYTVYHERPTTE